MKADSSQYCSYIEMDLRQYFGTSTSMQSSTVSGSSSDSSSSGEDVSDVESLEPAPLKKTRSSTTNPVIQ